MKLVDVSVDRPVLMTMIILGAVVLGLVSLQDLAVDLLPEVEFPIVTVRTIYPGAGPQEIESLISEKIEDAVSSVSGIKTLRSTSMEGVSIVLIELEVGTDVDVAASDVKDEIDQIKINLPEDAFDPTVLKLDLNARPVITMAVSGNRPLEDVYEIVDGIISDELSRVNGVASVDILGAKEREILVSIDQPRLDAFGISIMQVVQAISGGNLDLPGGRIKEERKEYTVRLSGEYIDLPEIESVEIPLMGQPPIRLKDVAQVIDSFKEQRELVRLNKNPGVGISIVKKSDANVVEVAYGIKDRIEYLKTQLPDDIKMEIMLDNSIFIEASIQDLVMNMIIGAILTAILLYLFLHSIRGVIIVGVSIPTSIIATFNLIKFAGFTVNFMSLMALAISVGTLVTNAIVVLENIQRHIEDKINPREASKFGTKEIAIAVLASTLTNIVVFTPIAFMKGIIGQFFLQFGLTVTFATIFSLITAFTLTPMLSAKLLKKAELGNTPLARFARKFEKFYAELAAAYRKAVHYTVQHRLLTVATVTIIFFGTFMGLGKYMGAAFFQQADQGIFTVQVRMPAGTNLEQTNKALIRIEKILQTRQQYIKGVYTTLGKITGNAALGGSTEGVDLGEITVDIGEKAERDFTTMEFFESLRREIVLSIPSAELTLREVSPAGGGDAPVQLQITGTDLDKLVEVAARSEKILKEAPNLVDIHSSWEAGKPEIQIVPRRKLIANYGLSVAQVALAIRYGIDGEVATQYRVGADEYDIRIRFSEEDKNSIQDLRKMTFLTPVGKIPITELCKISEGSGPTQINRKNKKKMITLTAGISYGAIGNVVADLKENLDQLNWQKGYEYFFTGQEERRQESQGEIGRALLLAIILTYMLLAAILESFVEPIFIMMTVPLALIGVIFSLVLTDNPLDIFSMMAVVMLVGIVVNNAILILDYVHIMRKKGESLLDSVLIACQTRLRPIIMANTAVILGMLPLALGIGRGAEMRAPMAIVSIGGIITSTFLTLFLIPMLYYSFEIWKEKRLVKKQG
ncbi:MAG: efflux RND transporter permease subunit [Calditrichaeota bacterium]|nr:efflux RND transporter permease subunit [Calditrichota bacterium]MCB0267734.1 efflux RND transporter permease subunit [Calditrichota bacterium]MCB0285006.1 efflux RND transporter permease subunit [Calditrichota bacterium]